MPKRRRDSIKQTQSSRIKKVNKEKKNINLWRFQKQQIFYGYCWIEKKKYNKISYLNYRRKETSEDFSALSLWLFDTLWLLNYFPSLSREKKRERDRESSLGNFLEGALTSSVVTRGAFSWYYLKFKKPFQN